MILARTLKGKGVKAVEDKNGFHGKPLADPEAAIEELGGVRDLRVTPPAPAEEGEPHRFETAAAELPKWDLGEEVATRDAYGHALAALGQTRAGTSWLSTARCPTRPFRMSSPRHTRTVTSRCSSPSSR